MAAGSERGPVGARQGRSQGAPWSRIRALGAPGPVAAGPAASAAASSQQPRPLMLPARGPGTTSIPVPVPSLGPHCCLALPGVWGLPRGSQQEPGPGSAVQQQQAGTCHPSPGINVLGRAVPWSLCLHPHLPASKVTGSQAGLAGGRGDHSQILSPYPSSVALPCARCWPAPGHPADGVATC